MEGFENNNIYELMRAIDRARRAWKNADPGVGINRSQFFTLMILRNKGKNQEKMTLSELAKDMRQTMPAISQRISKLEAMGYVEREQDKVDRRTVWLSLTDLGYKILEDSRKEMFIHMEKIISSMEAQHPGSVKQLVDSCNLLADAVEGEMEK